MGELDDATVISRTAADLLAASPNDDLYAVVGRSLEKLSDSRAVVVSRYDKQDDSVNLAYATGLSRLRDFLQRTIGLAFFTAHVPLSAMSAEEISAFTRGRLVRLEGGVHALSGRSIPQPVAVSIERVLGIRSVWTMGFSWQGRLFGGVSLLCRAEGEPPRRPAIEAVVTLGAIALQRAFSDEEGERLRNELAQAQKMEAVGRLAGGIAHDFNSLLTVISGYADILGEELSPDSPLRESAEEIRKAARRAAELTTQLLSFSRKSIVRPTALDLNAALAEFADMVRRVVGDDIGISLDLTPEGTWIRIDRGQLSQVVLNLAANARDAMPRGGQLRIATSLVTFSRESAGPLRELPPGEYALLTVRDSGAGMDAAVLSHLFEPFFTTKEPGRGTGLGLSTVHGIVRQARGTIAVESSPGTGTLMSVYLPRVAAAAPPTPPPETTGSSRGTETILVVEDESSLRTYLRSLLQGRGYEVLEAPDGPSAIALARENAGRIELMITDLVMPGMSGREVAGRVAVVAPELPVLYISGHTEDTVIRHGVERSSLAFIHKPFDAATLAAKVREMLDSPPGGLAGPLAASAPPLGAIDGREASDPFPSL